MLIDYTWIQDNLGQIMTLAIVVIGIMVIAAARGKKIAAAGTMTAIVVLGLLVFGMSQLVNTGFGERIAAALFS